MDQAIVCERSRNAAAPRFGSVDSNTLGHMTCLGRGMHASFLLALVAISLVLTGCPLSDRYYVEQDNTNVAGAGGARSSTNGGLGGASSVQGGAATGSTSASGGDGSSNATQFGCQDPRCAGECCSNQCTDLFNDSNHCGTCENACPVGRSCRSGKCYGWTFMKAPPTGFVPREKAAYTTFDGKLFVFGGLDAGGRALNDGAIYDPALDEWSLLPTDINAPSPRQLASAVWTGLRVFVVGGLDAPGKLALKDGARFEPASFSWVRMPALSVGRVSPLLINAKSGYVLSWGGTNERDEPLTGGERYNYNATSWTPLTAGPSSPDAVSEATWAPADSVAFIFGGRSSAAVAIGAAYQFDETNATWLPLAASPVSGRWGAFGVFDGEAFYVWGGRDGAGLLSDGARYGAGVWSQLGSASTISGRSTVLRRAGFAFALGSGDIAFLGGLDESDQPLLDGVRYQHATRTWSMIETWPSLERHEYGVFVQNSGELFVWGGRNGSSVTATGERYVP